ncbi:beta-ketoacyl-[acyl-carrier-protein] synthase family protein [Schlesneria sp. T3-172]|uniref:beta-ketoacyl-[acyl-carrier-protein] synthase family protein n=1 Tax=Schlesneria sphaerica TaxID=3373610 RepID=UPI0037C655C8
MDQRDSVCITGVGLTSSIGHGYEQFASSLLAGRSGIERVSAFEVTDHPSQIASLIGEIPCPEGYDEVDFRSRLRIEQCGIWCVESALRDAGWDKRPEHLRIGLVLGMGAEWMQSWEMDYRRGGRRAFDPMEEPAGVTTKIHQLLNLNGPQLTISAACASGNWAISQGKRWLDLGWVDLCIAGACDIGVTPLSLAGFGNLRALSRKNDAPHGALRPFDRDRDGMVLGEGGAVFLLEKTSAAVKRGARRYAEVAGFGATSDAHHMVIPCPEPQQGIAAMRQALVNSKVEPHEIDYINAHATGTPVGDICEAKILQAVLGDEVSHVPISSTKSLTGHLLSAAAAIEAVTCLVSLEKQLIPPTVNLDNTDPECAMLHHVRNEPQEREIDVTVSNSFGFGGNNTCLVLKKAA